MKTSDEVKLTNKPFEEMELLELYAERSARQWHRSQIKHCRERLKKREWWLKENMPIPTVEEIKEQYANGEMTDKQYKTAFARRKRAINQRMKNDDRMVYAERVAFHEEAVVAYLDELIDAKLIHAKEPSNGKVKKRKRDPRHPVSKYNPASIDPQRRWKTRTKDTAPTKLQMAKGRHRTLLKIEKSTMMVSKRMQPIIYWDVDKLMTVARDRGFYTEVALVASLAETLNISIGGASKLIETGKLTWSQCIIIGAVLEMTPKEFCDVFLSGYFKEVADGVFKAQISDDIDNLLDEPYRARPMIKEKEEVSDDE